MHRDSIRRMITLVALLLALPHRPHAQEVGDVPQGQRLSETWCSSCHVTSPGTASGTANGAPTFTAIAAMKSTTVLSLRAFLQTPHGRMPDLHLTHDEVDNIAAYILSLRNQSG